MALTYEDFIPLYNQIEQIINEIVENKNKSKCEYCCSGPVNEKKLYSDEDNYWFMLKSQTQNGKWYMAHKRRGFVGANCIQINNCPMCGRKLK